MDIVWGKKLTYKIDYSKYEQTYTDAAELAEMKRIASEIIIRNIDSRVNALGVSNYNAYTKVLNGQDYLIVELGWVQDDDQAADIIGKALELEFKLPNEGEATPEEIAQRRQLALDLRDIVFSQEQTIDIVAEGKDSDDVYYAEYKDLPLSQLPVLYQNVFGSLQNQKIGTLSDLFDGTYHVTAVQWPDGQPVLRELKGFTFVKLNDLRSEKREVVSRENVGEVATQFSLEFETDFSLNNQWTVEKTYSYNTQEQAIIHNDGEYFVGENAYDVLIYAFARESLIGKSPEEIEALEKKENALAETIKTQLIEWSTISNDDVQRYADGRAGESTLTERITSFATDATQPAKIGVEMYDEWQIIYVVQVREIKKAQDPLYAISRINWVTRTLLDDVRTSLNTEYYLSVQDVFVQEKSARILATDPETNQILNGAFFQQALLRTDQSGQPIVELNFDETGKEIFCRVSEANIGNSLWIFVWGKEVSVANILARICDGAPQISWGPWWFSVEEAKQLAQGLNEWTLPAPLILSQKESVSPTLGEKALEGAIIAGIIWLFVIFLLLRYMYGIRKSAAATLVLIAFLIYLLAVLKLPIIDYAFSLSGIAAIILALWMGVDANILIFERVREELKSWKRMSDAIEIGYARTWSAIRDGKR